MPIKPNTNEDKEEFINRCISTEVKKGHEPNQATAMCYSIWENNLRRVLLTEDFNIEDAKEFIERGYTLHVQSNRIAPIISDELKNKLKEVNIDENKVYFAPISKLMSIHDYKVIAWGDNALRENAQGETNLIRVERDGGHFYIGTQDRDLYQIIDVPSVPQNIGEFKDPTSRETMREFGVWEYNYINGEFVAL